MSKGMFIAFEGPDGVGKTSTMTGVAEELTKRGYGTDDIVTVIDPGTSTLGQTLRPILKGGQVPMTAFTQMLLFISCRAQMAQEIIIPALQQGKVVLCDRYTMSTLVYQFLAPAKKWEPMKNIVLESELVIPSAYVVLNADYAQLRRRRLASRWTDYFADPQFLQEMVKLALAKKSEKLVQLLKSQEKDGPSEIDNEELAEKLISYAKTNATMLRKHQGKNPPAVPLDVLAATLNKESISHRLFGQWRAWTAGQLEEAVEAVADGRFDDDEFQKAVSGCYYAAPSLIQGDAPVIREDTTDVTTEEVVKSVTDTIMKLKNG